MSVNKKKYNYDALVATDADNTLWDTNAVYAEGQLGLLEKIEKDVGSTAKTEDRLGFVRTIDQELARLHDYDLKYPVEFLVLAVAHCLKGMPATQAASEAIKYNLSELSDKIITKRVNWFFDHIIHKRPALRPGVSEGLGRLYAMHLKIIILTEGHGKRCRSLLETYKLNKFVSEVVVDRKDIDLYKKILKAYATQKSFMIGDQMDRDIMPAKKAGFITIFFPGGFQPKWISNNDISCPNYQISSFKEVPEIMKTYVPNKN